jgi:predicted DNA-binding protein (MmcQ/YjbR family)
MSKDPMHDKLLAIVMRLPEAEEDWPWGSIHCKVAGKIFIGWGRGEDGVMSLGFRTTPALQSMLVASDPRFSIAKYVGKYGGVDMKIGDRPNWDEIEQFIVESYRIIAPKRLVKLLDASSGTSATPARAKPAEEKRPASKPFAKVGTKPKLPGSATKKPIAKKATKRAKATKR